MNLKLSENFEEEFFDFVLLGILVGVIIAGCFPYIILFSFYRDTKIGKAFKYIEFGGNRFLFLIGFSGQLLILAYMFRFIS